MTKTSWVVSALAAIYIVCMTNKSITASFRLTAQEAETIDEAARTRDVPRATVIRWAIREFLNRNTPVTQHFMRG